MLTVEWIIIVVENLLPLEQLGIEEMGKNCGNVLTCLRLEQNSELSRSLSNEGLRLIGLNSSMRLFA